MNMVEYKSRTSPTRIVFLTLLVNVDPHKLANVAAQKVMNIYTPPPVSNCTILLMSISFHGKL